MAYVPEPSHPRSSAFIRLGVPSHSPSYRHVTVLDLLSAYLPTAGTSTITARASSMSVGVCPSSRCKAAPTTCPGSSAPKRCARCEGVRGGGCGGGHCLHPPSRTFQCSLATCAISTPETSTLSTVSSPNQHIRCVVHGCHDPVRAEVNLNTGHAFKFLVCCSGGRLGLLG